MSDTDRTECKEFAIMVWTMDLISALARTEDEASILIALAASYGPPRTTTTD